MHDKILQDINYDYNYTNCKTKITNAFMKLPLYNYTYDYTCHYPKGM